MLIISFVSQVGAYFVISCFIGIFYPVLFVYSISVQTGFILVWLDNPTLHGVYQILHTACTEHALPFINHHWSVRSSRKTLHNLPFRMSSI